MADKFLLAGLLGAVAYIVGGIVGFAVYITALVVAVFLAIRNAVRNYDGFKSKGIDVDERGDELKKIDGEIEVCYDLFGLAIDVPSGIDKNMVLQYVLDGVRVRVKRRYFPF